MTGWAVGLLVLFWVGFGLWFGTTMGKVIKRADQHRKEFRDHR